MAFWYGWPSWVVELVGGAALSLVAGAVLRDWRLAAVVGVLLSVIYERFFDRNGWSWSDVGQRAVGQAVGLFAVWWWLR